MELILNQYLHLSSLQIEMDRNGISTAFIPNFEHIGHNIRHINLVPFHFQSGIQQTGSHSQTFQFIIH